MGVNEPSHLGQVMLQELEAEALKTDFSLGLDFFYFLGDNYREFDSPFKGSHQVPEDG